MTRSLVAASAILLGMAVVTGCASAPKESGSSASGVAGYWWKVTSIGSPGSTFAYDSTIEEPPKLVFRPDGILEADDGVNYLDNGRFHLTDNGYRVSGQIGSTFVALAVSTGPVALSQAAIDAAMNSGHTMRATVAGTSLTVVAGQYTITLHRAGPVGDPGPLVTTPLPSSPTH